MLNDYPCRCTTCGAAQTVQASPTTWKPPYHCDSCPDGLLEQDYSLKSISTGKGPTTGAKRYAAK